jgi:quinol monooxygenase YgiN
MSDKTLSVIARLKAKEGKEAQLESALKAVLIPTRNEQGCVNYDLHVNSENPGEFFFYENWVSTCDLDRHLQSEHIVALKNKAAELLAEPAEIIRCWKVDSNSVA